MNTRREVVWMIMAFAAPLCALGLLHLFVHRNDGRWAGVCHSQLNLIGLGLAVYRQDNDSRFPPCIIEGPQAGLALGDIRQPVGWADSLMPYIKNGSGFICPLRDERMGGPQIGSPMQANLRGASDYWMNGNLNALDSSRLTTPSATLAVGEGNDGTDLTDATYNITHLPSHWLDDTNMPPWRHMGGGNYLYADGHGAWQRPAQVSHNYGRANCFAVK